jgi:hypothetical protein
VLRHSVSCGWRDDFLSTRRGKTGTDDHAQKRGLLRRTLVGNEVQVNESLVAVGTALRNPGDGHFGGSYLRAISKTASPLPALQGVGRSSDEVGLWFLEGYRRAIAVSPDSHRKLPRPNMIAIHETLHLAVALFGRRMSVCEEERTCCEPNAVTDCERSDDRVCWLHADTRMLAPRPQMRVLKRPIAMRAECVQQFEYTKVQRFRDRSDRPLDRP